jgi:hypothetical protein
VVHLWAAHRLFQSEHVDAVNEKTRLHSDKRPRQRLTCWT